MSPNLYSYLTEMLVAKVNILGDPKWLDKPTNPGIYWCEGKDGVYEIVRVAFLKNDMLVMMFPGINLAYAFGTVSIKRWFGPLILADFPACTISAEGFYQPIDSPVEPNNPIRKKRSKKSG